MAFISASSVRQISVATPRINCLRVNCRGEVLRANSSPTIRGQNSQRQRKAADSSLAASLKKAGRNDVTGFIHLMPGPGRDLRLDLVLALQQGLVLRDGRIQNDSIRFEDRNASVLVQLQSQLPEVPTSLHTP